MASRDVRTTPTRIATAALKGFFKITEQWELAAKQESILLGEPDEFDIWKYDKSATQLDDNVLERISYILGIYKSLRIMHGNENQRHFLNNAANHSPFNGKSPLDLMLSGEVQTVRRYLDGKLQAPYT